MPLLITTQRAHPYTVEPSIAVIFQLEDSDFDLWSRLACKANAQAQDLQSKKLFAIYSEKYHWHIRRGYCSSKRSIGTEY